MSRLLVTLIAFCFILAVTCNNFLSINSSCEEPTEFWISKHNEAWCTSFSGNNAYIITICSFNHVGCSLQLKLLKNNFKLLIHFQIKPGKTVVVYMPIVPTRLGEIDVTIMTKSQVAKHIITRTIHVEVLISLHYYSDYFSLFIKY